MKTILVSIISEQAVPNYLFIKEFYNSVDRFLFISTEQMEKRDKTKFLCEALKIDKNKIIKTLITDDFLYQNLEKLKKLNLPDDNTYLVNLTGGTKMMSLTVWRFFHQFKNVRLFYIPIGKKYYNELFENKNAIQNSFSVEISCKDYLNIYGIRYEENEMIYSHNNAMEIFKELKVAQYDFEKLTVNKLKKLNIDDSNMMNYSKWFEEYVYYRIKDELRLKDDQILTGIRLYEMIEEQGNDRYSNDNELDIFFIYNNRPYIIECKLKTGKETVNIRNLHNYIYKLSSVNKRFGLTAKATLITFSDLSTLSIKAAEGIQRRCSIANVYYPFFDRSSFDSTFKIYLEKFLK
jgi:hypothetical protein